MCVDHEDGAIMSMTLWQNRMAMDESERKAAGLRQEAAKQVDGQVVSVQSLDVVIEIGVGVPQLVGHNRACGAHAFV